MLTAAAPPVVHGGGCIARGRAITDAVHPHCWLRRMLRSEAVLPIPVDAVRRRLNALARPRRGLLHTPDNGFDHSDRDASKPCWGHWKDGRFRLRPQQVSHWHTLHRWRAHFDGEVLAEEGGSRVRVQASLGTAQNLIVLLLVSALLLPGLLNLSLQRFDWLLFCFLAAVLLGGVHAYLKRALRRLLARLAAD